MKKVLLMLMLIPMLVSAKSLSDGLVAWWKFDGDAKDATANHHDGIPCGTTLTVDRFGRENSAYLFSHGKFIMVPNDPQLQNLYKETTVSAWIRPTGWHETRWNGLMPILCKGSRDRNIGLCIFRGNPLSFEMGMGGRVPMKNVPTLNVWQHILCSANGDRTDFYINGELVGCAVTGLRALSNNEPLKIGCDDPGTVEHFYGAMDDIRIYDRALTAEEAKEIYSVSNEEGSTAEARDNAEGDEGDASDEDASEEERKLFVLPTAVPSQAQIDKAIKIIAELCADDIKAAKDGKISNAELAKRFLAQVSKTDNVSVKFVLLRNAYKRLLMAKSVGSAQKIFDKVEIKYGARFAVAMANASDANLKSLLKSGKTAGAAQKLSTQIDELSACIDKIKAADEILKKSPAEARPKRDKAFNCLKIGDWQAAFELYEKMDDDRGKVAKWEQAKPESRSSDYTAEKVGDYWWSTIVDAKEGGALFRSVSRHAAYWYRQALRDGGMSEMKVELVKSRIARTPVSASKSSLKENDEDDTNDESVNNGGSSMKSKDIILVPTSDIKQTKWKYRTQAPSGNWTQTRYNDRDWYEGMSTFCSGCVRGAQGTIWSTRDIYLRKEFDCAYNSSSIAMAVLKYCIDDDIEIWLNGTKIYEYGITSEYQEVKPMKALVKGLKKGKNMLAVHARNTGGPGYVDVGVTIQLK